MALNSLSTEELELQMKKLELEVRRKKELEASRSTSINDDKLVISKFHGGVATKAILPNFKDFANQELLQLPDDIKLYSNSIPTQAKQQLFKSFKESSNFISSFVSSKFSKESSVGLKATIPIFKVPLSIGGNRESSSSSGSSNSNAHGNSSSKHEMSVVIYEYISKGSFDLPPSQIILSKAAERRASRINCLKDAFDFFEEFGAFYPVCSYTVGGIFMCEVQASGSSKSNSSEFSSSASSAISSKVGGSIGIPGLELSGSKGSSSASESGGGQKNSSASENLNVELRCLNFGPQHVNIEEFRKAVNQNRHEWTNIGTRLIKLKPIYEIIEDTDNKSLDSAVFYLKVAHITKNLETQMIDQIEKKFEKANQDKNFDIDLFLSNLSKDIQEIAIEEFTKMSNTTDQNDNTIFSKFEKWMKQVYNGKVNQNLEIIQKILDIDVDLPGPDTQINNIYLESKDKFAFILYYNEKYKRLEHNRWMDMLECMKNLKEANDNEGHYILCNLDLHQEVDDVEEMCLKVYFEGNQKVLMYANDDFLEFHKIMPGKTEIELSNKKFTYYFSKEIFSNFRNLKKLSFTKSSLSVIDEKSFSSLSKLETLDLSENRIRLIEKQSFVDLKSLKFLNLKNNNIEELDEDIFNGLNNLNKVLISSNLINSINSLAFSNLVNLRILHLGGNKLNTITDTMFKGLSNLEQLILHDNKISLIDDFSFQELKNLQNLVLKNNKLSHLSNNVFVGLENLRVLDLSSNLLSGFESDVFKSLLNCLEEIGIDDNQAEKDDLLKDVKFKSMKNKNYSYSDNDLN